MDVQKTSGPAPGEAVEIWVVEANELLRNSLEDVISRTEGMRCPLAANCCEAAIRALEAGEAPDMVLMDIGLPGMSGVEGARRVRALSPSTRVIMLTLHEDHAHLFDALCAGASGYLLKPASRARVVEAIREMCHGGTEINAEVARRVLGMLTELEAPPEQIGLSDREVKILQLLVEGLPRSKVAERILRSEQMVNTHIRNIYAKLQVNTGAGH